MERWRDGEMERWRDGRWGDGDGEIEKYVPMPIGSSRASELEDSGGVDADTHSVRHQRPIKGISFSSCLLSVNKS